MSTQLTPHARATLTPAVHGVVRGHAVTAVNILRTRLAESWTLNALAEEAHLSRSQLVRSFDATVGMSPMAYLRQMRVERMARLLVSTDLSIAEAARSVGWRNQFHASQCFHAAYGISPTEYRRSQTAPPVH
jgi:AraC family transcriptional regulator